MSNVLTVALGDDRVQATADQLVGNCVQSDVQFMHDWQRPRLQLQAVNE